MATKARDSQRLDIVVLVDTPKLFSSLVPLLAIELRRVVFVPLRLFLVSRRLAQGADDAEAQKLRIGQIPDALRLLWVLLLPAFVGIAPSGAAKPLRLVVPRPAADNAVVFLGGNRQGI